MTLNAKMGFYGFFGDFGLQDTLQKRIVPKSIVIDMKKLWMKFLASSIDFDGLSLYFLGSRKPVLEGIKERYAIKVDILPLLASLSWKRLQIGMGIRALHGPGLKISSRNPARLGQVGLRKLIKITISQICIWHH